MRLSAYPLKVLSVAKGLRSWLPFLTIAVFTVGLGLMKTWPALTTPDFSISEARGDGVGGQIFIFAVAERIQKDGWGIVWGDTFEMPQIGLGFRGVSALTQYWKANFAVLTQFFDTDNVFDFCVFLAYVMIILCGYGLGREIGFSYLLSWIFGLTIGNLDFFYRKMITHLFGFATYYGTVLVIWSLVRLLKRPTIRSAVIAGAIWSLNFQINEYLGYFGLWLIATCVVVSMGLDLPYKRLQLFKMYILAGASFFAFMWVVYPSQIRNRVIGIFSQNPPYVPLSHRVFGPEEFIFWSVRKPLYLLRIGLPGWYEAWRGVDVPASQEEMCVRYGFFFPIITLCLALFLPWKKFRASDAVAARPWLAPSLFSLSILVMFLVSLNPEHAISLANVTMKFVPYFRVSTRAMIYTEILITLSGYLLLARLFCWAPFNNSTPILADYRPWQGTLILFIYVIGFGDLTRGELLQPFEIRRLPDHAGFEVVGEEHNQGLLLELPFELPGDMMYWYHYRRSFHKKPTLNTEWYYEKNPALYTNFARFLGKADNLTPEYADEMAHHGLRYLVINAEVREKYSWVPRDPDMELMISVPQRDIYKLRRWNANAHDFLQKMILENRP